jgi:ArsR family transcriptional regulator, arsenate/arsenite/antimonite-responsive transcriptional repressor
MEAVMAYGYAEYIPVLKALADETRLKILDMLSCGELCACKILEQFSITQPTLSYHMKMLSECGLVTARRDGAWIHYSICAARAKQLTEYIDALMSDKPDCICHEGGSCDE